jgi:hypothetical protein
MTTRIYIERLRYDDGRDLYAPNNLKLRNQGQLYRTRLGGPDGEVLVERTVNPACPSCRALMVRGITGPFETWREGATYPHCEAISRSAPD